MIRTLCLFPLLLATACVDRGAEAVADYPAQYLCRIEAGMERSESRGEREAVRDEIARRGIECYEGVVKTDSPLF